MHYLSSLFILWVLLTAIFIDGKGCRTKICQNLSNIIKENVDENADPCDDFSIFVCGNYPKKHKIKPEHSTESILGDMIDRTMKSLQILLESEPYSSESHPQTKAAVYYRSCMDMNQRNKVSKAVILDFVKVLQKEHNYFERLQRLLSFGFRGGILYFEVHPDLTNPELNILHMYGPSFIMPDSMLLEHEEPVSQKQIKSLKKYMNTVLDLLGLWKDQRSVVDKIVDFNIQKAKIMQNDSDQHKFQSLTIGFLEERCPYIPLEKLVNYLLKGTDSMLNINDHVIVFSLPYWDNICKLFNGSKEIQEIMNLDLVWAGISSLVMLGSEEFIHAKGAYQSEVMETIGIQELWKRCVLSTSDMMADVVGNMYVKGNFHADSKEDVEDMLLNIRKALNEEIIEINWMDQKTKQEALLKLESIHQKIGYSEKILNETYLFEKFKYVNIDFEQYIHNMLRCSALNYVDSMKGIGKKYQKNKWNITPLKTTANYNFIQNSITFPAAISRFPLYDVSLPVATNYGGMGAIMGHEILHAFDHSGSKFDNQGRMRNWWTKETRSKYLKKTQCLLDQYGNYTIHDRKVPSEVTIDEDIADNAGLRMAFKGFQMSTKEKTTLRGLKYTSEQLFFINYATTWCIHSTKQNDIHYMETDTHSIWKFRINGPISNMPEFSKAFKCSHQKKMNRHKKCLVW